MRLSCLKVGGLAVSEGGGRRFCTEQCKRQPSSGLVASRERMCLLVSLSDSKNGLLKKNIQIDFSCVLGFSKWPASICNPFVTSPVTKGHLYKRVANVEKDSSIKQTLKTEQNISQRKRWTSTLSSASAATRRLTRSPAPTAAPPSQRTPSATKTTPTPPPSPRSLSVSRRPM